MSCLEPPVAVARPRRTLRHLVTWLFGCAVHTRDAMCDGGSSFGHSDVVEKAYVVVEQKKIQ